MLSYREGENLLKIVDGKPEEAEKSVVGGLVKKGFLIQNGDKVIPTFCVIRKEKADNLPEDVRLKLRELKDAAIKQVVPLYRFVVDCISSEIPSFIPNKRVSGQISGSGYFVGTRCHS